MPRNGFTRIARFVFAVVDRVLVRQWRNQGRRDNLRALYGPVALVSLPLVWMLLATFGFAFVFWGIAEHHTAQQAFEISGSSLFTLGFAEPHGIGPDLAHLRRGDHRARPGRPLDRVPADHLRRPPPAREGDQRAAALRRHAPGPGRPAWQPVPAGRLDNPELWRTAANWMLDLDQTHSAFPALCYFPESSPEQSWVASVGSMLDAAALLLSTSDLSEGHAGEAIKGPMLALAYGMPTLVRIAQSAGLPVKTSDVLLSLVAHAAASDDPPPIAISRDEYDAALDQLEALFSVAENDREVAWREFAWIRSGYDLALRSLAGLTLAHDAPWTTDRAADVGRPRLFGQRPIHVTW